MRPGARPSSAAGMLRAVGAVVSGWGHHPSRAVVIGFAAAVLVGTVLLALPVAATGGRSAGWAAALFTATSAVCVTGLAVVDTAGHWSVFGEVDIGLLIQVGGLGIMTLATLFTAAVSGWLKLRSRLMAQAETKSLEVTGIGRTVRYVVLFSLVCESVVAVVLTGRFALGYGDSSCGVRGVRRAGRC
ncbi:potassium transporter TrkG [Spongiactinospora gelatinilytica]|uniref:potassium transporter TrkG n=1 Tax=Spongiactinospora gelatinilytica TaxID=2666298 RepID=UPI001F32B2EE|nr:potassium transporter TrkG [Spongiactinospora gelatinilytica]